MGEFFSGRETARIRELRRRRRRFERVEIRTREGD